MGRDGIQVEGHKWRLRNISAWPSPGCPPCEPNDKEELAACNTDPCPDSELCIDGQWEEWNDWEACSTSCAGGMRWRVRHVKTKATSCGDCILSEWSVWSSCSASCHGVKKRVRSVQQHGYGAGKYCEGGLEEAYPCSLGLSPNLVDWSSAELYLNLQSVAANNLNGKGPDFQAEKALRFKNVAADHLRVDDESDYQPEQGAVKNGLRGQFGNIFLERDSEVVLDFALVDSVTSDPTAAEDFLIKFFDSDDGMEGSDIATYSITAIDECEEFYNTPDSVFRVHGSCADPGETVFEKPFISDPGCDAGGYEILDLGNVINSNLLGKGPDLDGKGVDLVIEAVSSHYEPGDPQANGKFGGRTAYNKAAAMGAISMMPGTSTKFKASFKGPDGFAVFVPKFNFTFWDIDMPLDNLRERVLVFGYRKHYTVDQYGNPTEGNSVAYMQKPGGGEFSKPMDPTSPSGDQRDVAVTFFFESVAEFFFELEVSWIGPSVEQVDHQNQRFFFSAEACSGRLPSGYSSAASRRLQVFNVPWLPQAPIEHVVHTVQHQVQNQVQNQQEVVVYKAATDGICSKLPEPVTNWNPTEVHVKKEKEAIAIRFARKSRIRIKLKTGKQGCGHNFLFAAKACLSGHCDPCAEGSTCLFQTWEPWSACSAECEGGVEERKRGVAQGEPSSHGGGCEGALVSDWSSAELSGEDLKLFDSLKSQAVLLKQALRSFALRRNCQPADCKWAKWGPWSACSKCAGQKTRTRRLWRTPECGGRRCEAGDAEQIEKCPRNCGHDPICMWSDWSSFEPCSVTCGCGRKKRSRRLQKVYEKPRELEAAYETLERLDDRVHSLRSKRWKVRILAFLAGPACMLVAYAALRAWSRREAIGQAWAPLQPEPSYVDVEQDGLVETWRATM
eukprot:g10593.t2